MEFEETVTFKPPVLREKEGRLMRWPMLNPCVVEGSAINVTCEMLALSGVPTKNDWPYPTVVGAEVIVGREPLNK